MTPSQSGQIKSCDDPNPNNRSPSSTFHFKYSPGWTAHTIPTPPAKPRHPVLPPLPSPFPRSQDERDISKFRALLNHLVFGSPLSGERLLQVDHTQPLFVWTGKDTFDKIGPPQGVNKPPNFTTCGNEEHDRWKAPFETIFTPKEGSADSSGKDANFDPNDPDYAEPNVDSMRSVKDDELEQYRQSRAKKGATS